MKKIKVRFNLGKGKNYMKWKIEHNEKVEYVSPEEKNLIMINCVLKNNRKTAEKILNGEHKTVCAWILCDVIQILDRSVKNFRISKNRRLKYNPRVNPYWEIKGEDVDNSQFYTVYTNGRELYAK